MLDIMIDLETMSTLPHAAITQIGAVEFDLDSGAIGLTFQTHISLQSNADYARHIDADTVLWWMKQSDDARAAFALPSVSLAEALASFASWMSYRGETKELRVWGNGASFDNVILSSAYRSTGINMPWRYYNDRCYRTIKAMHPSVLMERTGTHHKALDDAISQAMHLIAIHNNAANSDAVGLK
jgi:exodeoxyribonuclease VIII